MSRRDIAWRVAVMVSGVLVSASCDEETNQVLMPMRCGLVKRETCVHILPIQAAIKEQLEYIFLTRTKRPIKRAGLAGMRVGAVIQQQPDDFDSTPSSCHMKGRRLKPFLIGTAGIRVGPMVEKNPHHMQMVPLKCKMKWRYACPEAI